VLGARWMLTREEDRLLQGRWSRSELKPTVFFLFSLPRESNFEIFKGEKHGSSIDEAARATHRRRPLCRRHGLPQFIRHCHCGEGSAPAPPRPCGWRALARYRQGPRAGTAVVGRAVATCVIMFAFVAPH
jgi:hypothetical protein